jgi:hypothetical protein
MTIREIAELTKTGETTIRRWITSAKMANELSAKMAEASKTKKAAEFTLDETIEILRAGKMSESLISLLKENAERKNLSVSEMSIDVMSKMLEMMNKLMDRMDRIEANQKQSQVKQLPETVETKKVVVEVEVVGLPPKMARAASAAVNNVIRKEEKLRRINEMCPDLFE